MTSLPNGVRIRFQKQLPTSPLQKKTIEDLQNSITQLNGNLGSLGATIAQLKTDVSENVQGQKDSETVRKNEYSDYEAEKTESEQCIGALKAAIKVLSSGSGKFLQNGAHATSAYEEAQLMSVAADVRGVLRKKVASQYMSEQDLQAVRSFVSNPAIGMSAMQTGQGQNPFGDYAPKSDQITGILQGLHDSFVASLEKANAKEVSDNKAFDDLMDTKKKELKTLTGDLDRQELDFAEKKRSLASHREELDDTKADLKADESLFQETEATCKQRAAEWSQRSKLRSLELDGIKEALKILTSKEAQKAFKGAASLVQLAQSQHRAVRVHSRSGVSFSTALRRRAYAQLRALAAQSESLGMARIAVQVKTGDAFDKVIMMIDRMVADLRKEAQDDIEHRDRCQNSENQNSNEKEDLAHSAGTMKEEIARVEETQKELRKSHDTSDQERKDTEQQMKDRLDLRNEENAEFKRAMQMNTEAVKAIVLAQQALKKFYEETGKAEKFLQTSSETVSMEAPKVSWGKEGGDYGGAKGMHKGAIGALDIIKEDLEKEISTGKAEDDENQAKYEKDFAAMEKSLNAKKDTIDAIKKQLAELGVHIEDKKATLSQNTEDSNEAEDMTKALQTDCEWVKKHFDTRHKQRKAEIAGLQEAKEHLAKAGQADEDDDLDMD
jgi:hypothetical protein